MKKKRSNDEHEKSHKALLFEKQNMREKDYFC